MLVGLTAFAIVIFLSTFVEYWGHRFMHRWLLRKRHARHHQLGTGQGWLGEFFDYSTGTLVLLWVGFLYSVEAGIGWAAGGLLYAAWAAYSHQLQHERPELCFWLRRPVHYLHHHHHMWHHNFGISVSLWDHVFGTYKKVDWQPPAGKSHSPLDYLRIKWLGWGSKPAPRGAPARPPADVPAKVS
jgi:sterol desaturase/sphingolipid hydroxylase (fatty acid hydroxylase superfamily)